MSRSMTKPPSPLRFVLVLERLEQDACAAEGASEHSSEGT